MAAVLALQLHHWYTERRLSNRRGRLKRASLDSQHTAHSGGRQSRGERLSTAVTRHPADMASTPTIGRDDSTLYPFEPLDDETAAALSCSSTQPHSRPTVAADCSALPSPPSSSSIESAVPHHTRELSVSNEVPREQMFYGLLNIIATVPTPHEANIAAAQTLHHAGEGQPAGSSTSAPASTAASPRRSPGLPSYQHSSHSSDHLQPHHHSSSSLSLPPPAASAATDKRLIKALHDKWQRQQRRRAKRERRAARLAGLLLDDASTASPSNSSVSSASALGDEETDEMADSVDHRLDFEYESGEEEADSYKREEFKQPVFLSSSTASTASSSTASPTHSTHSSRSPSASPLSLSFMPRSPQRLAGQSVAALKARLDFNGVSVQRHHGRTATEDETEMKR